MRRLPWIAIGLVAASALVQAIPALAEWLIYDRTAVHGGQWWRPVTAHLVHFSPAHLAWNVLALLAAFAMLQREHRNTAALAIAITSMCAGVAVHFGDASLQRYAGLSALGYAAFTTVALTRASERSRGSAGWLVLLVVLAAKLLLERDRGVPVFWDAAHGIQAAVDSHLAGIASTAVAWMAARVRRSGQPNSSSIRSRISSSDLP